ncbi:MAG: pyridoxal-phosphate dependent enzyme [Ignavibacteriae bacterium]|nr:MAG: pyridoxal-phosphate dependent enzyme [Ignavibacteriota bacterium]
MKYYNSIIELVGNTPLVKLNKLTKGFKSQVFAKMESLNPGGSVKDRIGSAMIEDAEKRGVLNPGGTVVEATSGNTGIGLALAAAVKGYKSIFVMTDKVSVEKRRYLKALGADIIICPIDAKPDSPEHYVNTAKRIANDTPNSFFAYQYTNPANPVVHYKTTGPEIWEQTDGKITHLVVSIGTGGTISGTGRFLKEKNSAIKIIGADPYGSIFKTYKETGIITEGKPYLVEGIGQDVLPENVHFRYIDDIINVTDKDSFYMARRLAREEGIFAGGSTGTVVCVALKVAKVLDENGIVVFMVNDTGERYLTKNHSDEWLREKRMLEKDLITLGIIHQTKLNDKIPELVSLKPGNLIRDAVEMLEKYDLSQLPVIENNQSVGTIIEADIITKLLSNPDISQKKVDEVMDKPLPVLDEFDDFKKVLKELKKSPAILVSEYGNISGIVTRHDVLDFV